MEEAGSEHAGAVEWFNAVSHLLGALAACGGLVVLVVLAAQHHDPWLVVANAVYGATLVFAYLASAGYHGLRGRAKRVFRQLDFMSIYFLIAGSYMPFVLGPLRGPRGFWLFGIVWGLALLGVLVEVFQRNPRRTLSLVLYLTMGWIAATTLSPLRAHLSLPAVHWLVVGGLFYTAGVPFFLLDRRWRVNHAIWHVFVLAGSAAQFLAVAGCVR